MTTHGSRYKSGSRSLHLVPGSGGRRGTSSVDSRDSDSFSSFGGGQKSNRKMRLVVIVGIALPVVAAVIGVVAWAVSADAVFPNPISQSLRSSESDMGSYSRDLLHVLEERSDLESNRNKMFHSDEQNNRRSPRQNSRPSSRLDDDLSLDADHFLPAPNEKRDDPLYIVHFVPTPKPKMESTSTPTTSTVSHDILNKILSVSKGTKPGTPQFVVFAPIPGDEDQDKTDVRKINQPRKNHEPNDLKNDYEYEYVDSASEATKKSEKFSQVSSRIGESQNVATSSGTPKIVPGYNFKLPPPNSTSGRASTFHQYSNNAGQSYEEQFFKNLQAPPPPPQSQTRHRQIQPQHLPPQILPQQQNPHYQPSNYPPTSYHAPPHNSGQIYSPPPSPKQQDDPGRSGYVGEEHTPIIKLNLGGGHGGHGGGHRGLLGGGYSPLGIIASILRPILPKPAVNLNGKMMFGVMLENGLKFGGNKHPHPHY